MSKSRLQDKYEKEVMPVLSNEFGVKNKHAIPGLTKVVINMGVGEAAKNSAQLEAFKKDISAITGQTPSIRKAKQSIAGFGLREGTPVGLAVTLRGGKMYSFLDRLFSITLPRLRDFRGVPIKSFDSHGNYTLGFLEHTVFPEIEAGKAAAPHGMEVTIVVNTNSSKSEKEASVVKSKRLLELLGCPFEKV